MTPKEQEIAIKELEERVDRLRNIYEQYFLGFERLEPTVPRKDVDRRLAILRKEQIRNTAMRFRFNVITQKYNTYAMHWVRICRQIEEGTYKRHVRRAKARFGELSTQPDREASIDIDIDIDDFDDLDVDNALAEANAASENFERDERDTVPPVVPILRTPAQAFPVAAHPEPGSEPSPRDRAARPVALPPGAKPRIVLRKREDGEPAAPPATPRVLPAPAASAGRIPVAPPAAPAASAGRIPVAPPAAPAASAGRIPVAPPAAPATSAGRIPVAPPAAPAASAGRIPVAPPAAPAASAGRIPVAPPAPSAGRIPNAPVGVPAGPQIRQRPPAGAAPPQPQGRPLPSPSGPRLPGGPVGPVAPAPPRARMPSFTDDDNDPETPLVQAPPVTRPRAPAPPPGQPRPVKKE